MPCMDTVFGACRGRLIFVIAALVGMGCGHAGLLGDGPVAAGVVVYVSPAGNDAWTGGSAAPDAKHSDGPVASLERARDIVRGRRANGGADEPVRVVLADGRYQLARPFALGPEDGGSAAATVTYEAAPGARPVISGGRPITGFRAGTGDDTGLWVADLPAAARPEGSADRWRFAELFVNGSRAVRAREPDGGVFPVMACTEESLTTDKRPVADATKERLQRARQTVTLSAEAAAALAAVPSADMPQAQFIVHHKWDVTRRFIESIDAGQHTLATSGLGLKPWNRWDKKSTAVLEDARAFLDEPGEWFLSAAGRLLYKPRPGESLATAEVIAPAVDQLLVIRGDLPRHRMVEHVSFVGIAFEHASWTMPRGGFEPVQAAASVGAAVMVDGGRGVTFRDCRIAHVGGYGLWLRTGCRDCRVERCLIEDLGAGGVRIGDTALPKTEAEATAGNTLDNCIIRRGGRILPCGVAVWVGHSSDNAITHNDIHDFFYTGVSLGWTWGYGQTACRRNRVADNHIHLLGQGLLSDMGGVYTLGAVEGTLVRGNRLHDIAGHAYGGWGLYADEGSTGVVFEHNLVYDTTSGGFHLHYGRDNTLRHNVFVNARDAQVKVSRPEDHRSFTFERNIIVWRQGKPLAGPWDRVQAVTGHNCWWNTAAAPVMFLDKSLAEWQAAGHEQGSIVADPEFLAPERHEYRLPSSSPAFALGFVPYDWTRAGVYGDPAWVARADFFTESFP